jgi:hypothetical protein
VKLSACFLAALLSCSPLLADDCARFATGQKADAESVRQVERQWSKAFLSGDTDFLECLLEPDYESVWFTGEVRSRQTIIDKASAHRANPIPVPETPAPIIQVHGNTAISRSDQDVLDPVSKQSKRVRFLDVFAFYEGRWHVLFTQDAVIRP